MTRTELRDALTGLYNHTDDPRLIEEIRKVVEKVAGASALVPEAGLHGPFAHLVIALGLNEEHWRTSDSPETMSGFVSLPMFTKVDPFAYLPEDAKLPAEPAPEYVVWSNEHRAWWGPNRAGYCTKLENAGRYDREAALAICDGARGGRQYNDNPSEVPVLFADAERFWPNDKPEWSAARFRCRMASEQEESA